MKLLMFFCPEFSSTPFKKTIEEGDEDPPSLKVQDAVVVFYHVEEQDEKDQGKVLNKAIKNIKWLANKFKTKIIVLHSFNHLSSSKARPSVVPPMVAHIRNRLEKVGYEVKETPFGWLNTWTMTVAGESLAKVFKDLSS